MCLVSPVAQNGGYTQQTLSLCFQNTTVEQQKERHMTQDIADRPSYHLYINLQKILRALTFGRSLSQATAPLTVTQTRLLAFFNEKDVVHLSDMSRVLPMSIQSINNIIQRLENTGYVKRSKNKQDKRFSDIRLTPKGRKKLESFRDDQVEALDIILNVLEPSERKILNSTVEASAVILEKASRGLIEQGKVPSKKVES